MTAFTMFATKMMKKLLCSIRPLWMDTTPGSPSASFSRLLQPQTKTAEQRLIPRPSRDAWCMSMTLEEKTLLWNTTRPSYV